MAIAELGRALARSGYLVATGGGPGLMEAANLGAWFAAYPDDDLDAALDVLTGAPTYPSRPGPVRVGGGHGARTMARLGATASACRPGCMPTSRPARSPPMWRSTSPTASARTACWRSPAPGVVYAPGGAGTAQEIFTDAAQNTNTLYEVRSPMVFFERAFYEEAEPELLAAVRRQAAAFGWAELVTVVDDAADVLAFLGAHDPDDRGQHRGPRSPASRRTLTDAPLRLAASAAELADDFARVRHDLAVPTGFDADVIAEAARVARDGPQPPPGAAGARLDARDLDLVTVDPPGTRDLDQAFHAETHRHRLPRALRDRRRGRLRHPRRRARPRGVRARGHAVPARRPGAALPRRPRRRCGQPPARGRPPGAALDLRPGRRGERLRDPVRPGHGAESRRALVRRGPAFAGRRVSRSRRSPSCARSACTCSTASGSGAA